MFAFRLKPVKPDVKENGFLDKISVSNTFLAITEVIDESATCYLVNRVDIPEFEKYIASVNSEQVRFRYYDMKQGTDLTFSPSSSLPES